MTNKIILVSSATFGMLAIILGAFAAHALKRKLNENQIKSFETGVKYQMYHAIVLLVIGMNLPSISSSIAFCFILGTFLFSFSIYGLVLSEYKNRKLRFLVPVTPIGGLLLVIGWALLLFSFLN